MAGHGSRSACQRATSAIFPVTGAGPSSIYDHRSRVIGVRARPIAWVTLSRSAPSSASALAAKPCRNLWTVRGTGSLRPSFALMIARVSRLVGVPLCDRLALLRVDEEHPVRLLAVAAGAQRVRTGRPPGPAGLGAHLASSWDRGPAVRHAQVLVAQVADEEQARLPLSDAHRAQEAEQRAVHVAEAERAAMGCSEEHVGSSRWPSETTIASVGQRSTSRSRTPRLMGGAHDLPRPSSESPRRTPREPTRS